MRPVRGDASNARAGWRREAIIYAVVGGIQLGVDWLSFVLLTVSGMAVGPANLAARVAGAALGFWLNGRFTFAPADRQGVATPRKLLRFLLFWLAATALSTGAVAGLEGALGLHAAWLGKPLVDAALAVLGFLVSKKWIYR